MRAYSGSSTPCFNPRSRAGSDGSGCAGQAGRGSFNPRSRAGSDIFFPSSTIIMQTLQSTLPCGERRKMPAFTPRSANASIHAPVRGATTQRHAARIGKKQRFNPRSRAGSDMVTPPGLGMPTCFNPRSRAGSDGGHPAAPCTVHASIHAPVRGATTAGQWRPARRELQSTLPCGERRMVCWYISLWASFNPRSRAGSDCGPFLPLPCNDIQGIFRAGHISRSIYAINKSALKNYLNKTILLKNREPPRKMLCTSGSRGLLPAAHRVPFSQSDIC